MSSSLPNLSENQGFGLVQSGVVAWESVVPVADWSTKTLSLVVRQLDVLSSLFRELLCCGIDGLKFAARLHVSALPAAVSAAQMQRILITLQKDPPGMRNTIVEAVGNTHAYVLSEIAQPQQVVLDYLTASRATVVVATANEGESLTLVRHASAAWKVFDANALRELRERLPGACLLRVVDTETHCALQVIGDSGLVSQVWNHVAGMGLRKISSPMQVSGAIEQLA